jgi:hypothetical protein
VTNHSRSCRKIQVSPLTLLSSKLEHECKNFKVKLVKPHTTESFMGALKTLREDRRKAENVLLDEIETDIDNKEKFITEQVNALSEMQSSKNTLIEHRCVLTTSSGIINGSLAVRGSFQDEEQKQGEEIQMQDISSRQPGGTNTDFHMS